MTKFNSGSDFLDTAGAVGSQTGIDNVQFGASTSVPVPGPIAGAGLPGLLLASGGLHRRRPRSCQTTESLFEAPSTDFCNKICHERTRALQSEACCWLFNHLVGAAKQSKRQREAERSSSLQVDQ